MNQAASPSVPWIGIPVSAKTKRRRGEQETGQDSFVSPRETEYSVNDPFTETRNTRGWS